MPSNPKLVLAIVHLFICGCASIPDADTAFLDHYISVGMSVDEALTRIEKRGFTPIEIRATPHVRYDSETQKFDELHLSFEEMVKQNIGFVSLTGKLARTGNPRTPRQFKT